MKTMDSFRGGAARLAVPTTLSDMPTIPSKVDLDRTIPMEPIVLAALCAQTQISERRRPLPKALEYSVHLQSAAELGAAAVTPAVTRPPAAEPSAPRHPVGDPRRQTLMLILGPFVGLSLGMSVAWQLDLGRARPARPVATARQLPAKGAVPVPAGRSLLGTALPRASVALPTPTAVLPSAPSLPTAAGLPTAAAAVPLTAAGLPTAAAAVPPTASPGGAAPRELTLAETLVSVERPAGSRAVASGRKPQALRPGSSHQLGPAVTSVEEPAVLPLAAPPVAAPPPSETTALPPVPPAVAPKPGPTVAELDHGRVPRYLSGTRPQLPLMVRQMYRHELVVGTYRLCVQPSGVVASVTAVAGIPFDEDIKRALQTWRFAPRAAPACVEQELHFEVDQ